MIYIAGPKLHPPVGHRAKYDSTGKYWSTAMDNTFNNTNNSNHNVFEENYRLVLSLKLY